MTYLLLLLRYRGSENGHALIFKTFLFLIQFWCFFFANDFLWKCNKSYSKNFFVKFTVFCVKEVKGFKKWDFAGDEKFIVLIRFWRGSFALSELKVFRPQIFLISYRFRARRGQIGGRMGWKFNFKLYGNILFSSVFDWVFSKWFLWKI